MVFIAVESANSGKFDFLKEVEISWCFIQGNFCCQQCMTYSWREEKSMTSDDLCKKTSLNSSEIFHHSFLHFTFFDVSLFGVIHKISTPIWQKWTVMFCHPFQPRVNRFSHTEIMHLWSNPGMVNILPKRRKSGYKQVWCLCTVSQCMKITWKVSFFIHCERSEYLLCPKMKTILKFAKSEIFWWKISSNCKM